MGRHLSKAEFIRRSRLRHGDTYDHSLVDWKSTTHAVRIICPHHGEFEQLPYNHMRGRGCARCVVEFPKPRPPRRMTTASFIARAREIHGERYDYAKVDVRGALEPVVILCRIHGPFAQRPANHLLGLGCTRCSQEERRIPVDVVEAEVRARYPHYALKRDSYTHRGKRATWRCNLHDCEFSRSVYELLSLRSTGCRGCAQAERAAKRQREGQDAATEERLALVAHGLGQRRADAYRLYTEGRTLAEIGRAFGVTREAVRQWLTAARKLLDTSG
jgi:hypothetical protein